MSKRLLTGLLAASAVILSPAVLAADPTEAYMTPAASIDSGLGEVPRYNGGSPEVWVYMQPALRQDNGLGEMPSVDQLHEVWMYMHPAAKMDSGLGDPREPSRVAERRTQGI